MVSIIIPAYNAEKSIKRCLDSLLGQTYSDIRLIVVDDGSSDATAEICDAYAATDARVQVIHAKNGGVSRARNIGIEQVTEGYIMFVDSDDYVTSDYVEAHVRRMEEDHAEWVISGFYYCYPDHVQQNQIPESCVGVFDREHYKDMFIPLYEREFLNVPWNKMYRRELITEKFPEDMSLGEDIQFNMAYLRNVKTIGCVSECCYYYILDPSSLGHKAKSENLKHIKANYEDLLDICKTFGITDTSAVRRQYNMNRKGQIKGLIKQKILHR